MDMSKRHFFLYDFLLPLAAILGLGRFFSDHFDSFIFRSLDSIKAFGLGAWFSHSPMRESLWNASWIFFAVVPALAWLVWVRLNMEYDWVNSRRRLDRPIFTFFQGIGRWIEGGAEVQKVRQAYEHRLAVAEDRVRRMQAEMAELTAAYDPAAGAADEEEEWQVGQLPPSQQGRPGVP
jgi:hypothetical protein